MRRFRLTREVRDLMVTMVVAVAGALAAWVLANLKTEPAGILAVVIVVALVLAVAAAVLLKAIQRPSEDSGKNDWIVERRSNQKKAAKQSKSAPGKSLAP